MKKQTFYMLYFYLSKWVVTGKDNGMIRFQKYSKLFYLSASLLTKSAGDIKNPEQGLIMCTRPVYL